MKKIILLIFCAVAATRLSAITPLDSLVMQTLDSDPALMSAAASAHARLAAVEAENIVESPEVEFEYLWGGEQNKWNAGISQRFDWPSLYRARSQAASSLSTLGDIEYLITYLDRALSIKLAVLDLINANKRLQITEEIHYYVALLGLITDEAYKKGEATILDMYKLNFALANCVCDMDNVKAEVQTLAANLRSMGAEISDLDIYSWQEFPIQELTEPSTEPENYPQWGAARARRDADRAAASVIRASSMPSFSLGYRHAYEEGTHYNGVAVSLTLPSFSRSRRLTSAEFEAAEAAFEYDSQLMTAIAESTGQYSKALLLQANINNYQELVEDKKYLELLEAAVEGGEMTIMDYILELKLFKEAYFNYIDLTYRYNIALARLNRYKHPIF